MIDMVLRMVSLLGYAPSAPIEAIEILTRENVLPREEAELLRKVVGFRNIVVHEYLRIDRDIVARILGERRYLKLVDIAKKILEEARKRGLARPSRFATRSNILHELSKPLEEFALRKQLEV